MNNTKKTGGYSSSRSDGYEKSDGKMGGRMRKPRRKVCTFCADKIMDIDYKDTPRLRKYVSERGKILPRRISGSCAKHQRQLTIAVKRSRHIALLPYTTD